MREIVSVLLECDIPSVKASAVADDRRSELLNVFTTSVCASKPRPEMGYRFLKNDLWNWCHERIAESVCSMQEALLTFLEISTASRNIDRLYKLWESSQCGEVDYVVTQKKSSSDADAPSALAASSTVSQVALKSTPTLSDWWYVGLSTDSAYRESQAALCKKIVEVCKNLSHINDLFDASFASTLRTIISTFESFSQLYPSNTATSSAPRGMVVDRPPHAATEAARRSLHSKTPLEMYRNLVEAPLLEELHRKFSDPSFFGWASFATTPNDVRRQMGMQVLKFAEQALAPSTVTPVASQFVLAVFADSLDAVDGTNPASLQRRLLSNDSSLIIDSIAWEYFPSSSRRAFREFLNDSIFTDLAVATGPTIPLGDLKVTLVNSIQQRCSAVAAQCFTDVLNSALQQCASKWSASCVELICSRAHKELRAMYVAPQPQAEPATAVLSVWAPAPTTAAAGGHDTAAALPCPTLSAGLLRFWDAVKDGISREGLEEGYFSRLLSRVVRQFNNLDRDSSLSHIAELEDCVFSNVFFPKQSKIYCRVSHPRNSSNSTAECSNAYYRYRTSNVIQDLKASHQVQTIARDLLPGSLSPHSILILSSNVAGPQVESELRIHAIPKALKGSLELLAMSYNTLQQPNRTLFWVPNHSTIECSPIVNRELNIRMHHTHFCVLELFDEHHTSITGEAVGKALCVCPNVVLQCLQELVASTVLCVEGRTSSATGHHSLSLKDALLLNPAIMHSARGQLDVIRASKPKTCDARGASHLRAIMEADIMRLFKKGASLPLAEIALTEALVFFLASSRGVPTSKIILDSKAVLDITRRLLERDYLQLDPSTGNLIFCA